MEALDKITFLVGNKSIIKQMPDVPVKKLFAEDICEFLHAVSKALMSDTRSRQFPDVVTFAFWIRKASIQQMMERYADGSIRLGRGVAFHIAPSNVPVNFVYSLVSGLLTGNSNIVRVPSKDFPQVEIIADAVGRGLEEYAAVKPYIVLVRYAHEKDINDTLSSISDTRIIWGGDAAIAELRKSPLPPKSADITFADRYSLAVIDSDVYMGIENKVSIAEGFYNDTYLTDQNACTSPRIVIWTGNKKQEAKEIFWKLLHGLVDQKYTYQDIQGVNKLTSEYLAAAAIEGLKEEHHEDNLIIRVKTQEVTSGLMDLKDHSGYFFEYDCTDVMELYDICNDKRCQTIAMMGDHAWFLPLIKRGIKGVDRIVPIGKTMDFDLIWDGYDLVSQLSRIVSCIV